MEVEGARSDAADCDSLLPPRKRLLAGLRRQNCDCTPPISFVSDRLGACFQALPNSSSLSLEEVVETSQVAALSAARAACAARAAATDKAVAAANARAFARAMLELVASMVEDKHRGKIRLRRKKIKKKHVPVELLYKSRVPNPATDEELARRLHQAMNSSPRISRRLSKKPEASGTIRRLDAAGPCNGNPNSAVDSLKPSDENLLEKSGGKEATLFKTGCGEKVVANIGGQQSIAKGAVHSRRGRNKQKRLPLSRCCLKAREDYRELPPPDNHHLDEDSGDDTTEDMAIPTEIAAEGERMPLEAKPVWKKFKVSQCHSEGSTLDREKIPALCRKPCLLLKAVDDRTSSLASSLPSLE